MQTRTLSCGCCGVYFKTWEGYTDQDQDKGYGICESCQKWQEDNTNSQLDESIEKLYPTLNNKNKKKLDGMSKTQKRNLILSLINSGAITFTI